MRVARPALRPDAACGSVSSGSRARCRAHRRWLHRRGPPTGAHLRPRQRDSLSLSGGCFQRQIVPQAVPGYGQPRPISRLGPRWPATQTFIFHTGAHSCRRTCMAHAALHDSSTRAPWPGRLNWVRTCQSKVGWRAWSAGARELYCTSPSSVNSARASRVAYRHGATATRRAGRPESAAAHVGRRNIACAVLARKDDAFFWLLPSPLHCTRIQTSACSTSIAKSNDHSSRRTFRGPITSAETAH